MSERMSKDWTQAEAKLNALQLHPDCSYAEVRNGMAFPFVLTWVIELWRNEECYLSGDPPKYTEQSYPARASA